MRTIVLTIFGCLVVATLAAIGFIYSGLYDVSALHPDNPVIAWALHTTSDRSVNARLGGINVPEGLDKPEIVNAGGKLFAEHCAICHGGPGLNPQPAKLFNPRRHPRMGEMYRFIHDGVKMTAMPGFGRSLSDQEIWSLAAFLRTAPGMSPKEFAEKTGLSVPGAMPAPAASGSAQR